MSTFVTGVPGTGKTAQVVYELHERIKVNPTVKIYQHGIRELKLPHIQVYCLSDECLACRDVEKTPELLLAENWHEWAQAGDLLVFDEVQRIWSPRHVASKRPKGVSMMETHRHFGIEFWLMTQHPKLVDADIRRQMRKHVHVTAGWSGRKLYEWDTVSDVLKLTSARERSFKLPSEIFDLYKSSDQHIQISRKKPISFYFTIAAFVIAVIASGFVFYRIKSKINPVHVSQVPVGEPTAVQSGAIDNSQPSNPDFTPKIPGKPESAPAYAHLLEVKSVPTLAGCIKSKNSCKCYTAQATPYPATYIQCLEHVMNLHFNPYVSTSGASVVPISNDMPVVKRVSADSSGLKKVPMSEPVQQITESMD